MKKAKNIATGLIVINTLIVAGLFISFPACKKSPPAGQLVHDTIRVIKYDTIRVTCDTNVYTYSGAVSYILNANCATVGCHTTAGAAACLGYDLSYYAGVDSAVKKGRLMGSINQLTGYFAMPKSGGKLSNCEIKVIQKWINGGALNN